MNTPAFPKGTRLMDRNNRLVTVVATEEVGNFTIYKLRAADGYEFKATEEAMRKLFRPETGRRIEA